MSADDPQSDEFRRRREELKSRIGQAGWEAAETGRASFFNAVYNSAKGDPAAVPWADLEPKPQLMEWLASNSGAGRTALDVACGLGDNAEALAGAGYRTTAFDLSGEAIEWAHRRFPRSEVSYRVADILAPPADWSAAFDLVHECYTLQSVPPQMLDEMAPAIAGLVAPSGTLLVYTRIRGNDDEVDGPPWPLREADALRFAELGLELVATNAFEIIRPGRTIPHWFTQWRKA